MTVQSTGNHGPAARTAEIRNLDSRQPSSRRTALWWVSLMLFAAAVPATTAFALTGSAVNGAVMALCTLICIALAALMI
ncbi:hypothetical protein ERC79_16370 [Rhodococcus sp. ABRD24]|uniref:hypothetical protein n=1 Tax=Rhodococcus sp. ABRD24 TaxID=2507582 RepID=UPI00103B76C3|nr:hypothetical protein [Rhodococcus sp. ABRD24]QBJ97336.1 hypothetical protein ERC79_16370 [Rhodococcus sp. ABRD24]